MWIIYDSMHIIRSQDYLTTSCTVNGPMNTDEYTREYINMLLPVNHNYVRG